MKPRIDHWYCLRDGAHAAAFNMALDEVLLGTAATIGRPLLRFYEWSEAAATFGYSQKYAEVACQTSLRPLIRRPTGGGLVPHADDHTYTLVVPPTHPWYELRARESYRRAHEWVRRAFESLGWRTTLAAAARTGAPGQCFLGAEQFDVLWQGLKIAGAAQRRNRHGLLVQGSIQPPLGSPSRSDWQRAMLRVAAEDWAICWVWWDMPTAVLERAQQLAADKYSRAEYNERTQTR